MKQIRRVGQIGFQVLSPPEGMGVILEILDEYEDAFMEISIDPAGTRHVTFYETPEPISLTLSDLKRGIEIAERQVQNTDPDALFDD